MEWLKTFCWMQGKVCRAWVADQLQKLDKVHINYSPFLTDKNVSKATKYAEARKALQYKGLRAFLTFYNLHFDKTHFYFVSPQSLTAQRFAGFFDKFTFFFDIGIPIFYFSGG